MNYSVRVIILSVIALITCSREGDESFRISIFKGKKDRLTSLAERAQKVEDNTSIKKLKKEIQKQSKILDKLLTASRKIGQTYYLLGLKLLDYQMYGEALEYFMLAIGYYPEKPQLFYNIGISAGWVANAQTTQEKKNEYLDQAKTSLERALNLEPKLQEALLALAVLYSSSLNLPVEANNLIERYHKLSAPSSISQFLEARIAVQLNDVNRALEIYTDLSQIAPTEKERKMALQNRNEILGRER